VIACAFLPFKVVQGHRLLHKSKARIWFPWPWPWFISHLYECIVPHLDTILVCRELSPQLLPRWVPFFVGPSCQQLYSSLSADQVECLLWNALMIHSCRMIVVIKRCHPVLFLNSSFVTLSFQDISIVYFFAIYDEQHPVSLIVLLLAAITLHCTKESIGWWIHTIASLLIYYQWLAVTWTLSCTVSVIQSR